MFKTPIGTTPALLGPRCSSLISYSHELAETMASWGAHGGVGRAEEPEEAHVDGPPSTINLYLVDEVLSALQKAIRRTLVDEALFWTLELARSGLGALAMVRFGVMCSEDIALGCPCLPQYLLASRRRFVLLRCASFSTLAGGRVSCSAVPAP